VLLFLSAAFQQLSLLTCERSNLLGWNVSRQIRRIVERCRLFLVFRDHTPMDPLVNMLLTRIPSVAHVAMVNGIRRKDPAIVWEGVVDWPAFGRIHNGAADVRAGARLDSINIELERSLLMADVSAAAPVGQSSVPGFLRVRKQSFPSGKPYSKR
jgi:hypothetical protein